MDDTPQREMPKYQSHKVVWALKIAKIDKDIDKAKEEERETDGSAVITPESLPDDSYGAFTVDGQYMHKHNPEVGGYYVVYKDGYKSFSPADAFEEGYTKI